MGTLGLAAVLAIALAALRGTASAITDWRQRRMEAAAEAAPLRAARLKLQEAQMKADAASTGSGGRVPSSNEYGRRALARTGSGGGGSAGGGRSSGGSSGGRSGPGRTQASSGGTGSRTNSPSGSGGTGPGRKGGGSGPGSSGGSGSSTSGKGSSSGFGPGGGGKASGSGSDSSGGSGSGGGRRPGVLGQLALDHSKRRTSREAAAQKEAARQHKADLAERKRSRKDGDDSKGKGGKGTEENGDGQASTPTGKDVGESTGTGRVTLGKALGDEARRRAEERLRRRREDPAPPFLRRVPRDGETAEGAATTSTGDDTTETGNSGPDTPAGDATTSAPGDTTGTAPAGPGTTTGEPTGPDAGSATGKDGATGTGGEYPGGGGRRNPWDSLFEAMWAADVVWTVEQVDPPGAHARRWEPDAIAPARAGLPAGSSPAATATTTKETRVSTPLVPSPRTGGAASEHLTDVTLDDVLKSLSTSKTDCFATYDECAALADKARQLRDQLHVLAEELAQHHNVIGRLTSAAMRRLSESMDLLARKAEQMRTESMRAAEAVEVAHDEMHDAYKPVQQATADAGLVMPSARIHNED
ncbi:hypothetical protein [Streptomyces griseosporeus]